MLLILKWLYDQKCLNKLATIYHIILSNIVNVILTGTVLLHKLLHKPHTCHQFHQCFICVFYSGEPVTWFSFKHELTAQPRDKKFCVQARKPLPFLSFPFLTRGLMPALSFWEAFYWRKRRRAQGAKDRRRSQNSLWNRPLHASKKSLGTSLEQVQTFATVTL